MTVYESDDQGLRVIGYNHGIYFYDPARTLRCELYLQADGTLASNCTIVGSVGGGSVTSGLTGITAGSGIDVLANNPLAPTVRLSGYARGSIIRGGAADWEAYAASGAGKVLIGDGTDVVSRVLAAADLPTIPTLDTAVVNDAGDVVTNGGEIVWLF